MALAEPAMSNAVMVAGQPNSSRASATTATSAAAYESSATSRSAATGPIAICANALSSGTSGA